jgi:hypothetical protein
MKKILSAFLIILTGVITLNSCKKDINYAEGTVSPYAPLFYLKNAFKGSEVKLQKSDLDGAYLTGGIVISNNSGQNFPKGSMIMQNTARGLTRGIIIDLGTETIPFTPGDSVNIDITGGTLTNAGGALQLKVPASNITKISSNNTITPKTVALGELLANFQVYESTLVKVTADTKPLPASGEKYAGNKVLTDGGTNDLTIHTQATATFAGNGLPASATYTVIPFYGNANSDYGNDKQLRLRTIADVENASGPIYPGFPESFETPDATVKPSYNMNTPAVPDNSINLKTGNWKLEQSILGNLNANRDRYNAPGLQCIRMQQSLSVPCYVQMNFDLPNGASKVTFWQGAYSTDVSSTFKLQYSINGGTTWVDAIASGKTTANIQTLTGGSKQETYLFNISVPVRFRIMKLGLGASSAPTVLNGRLCIEDIAVYSN